MKLSVTCDPRQIVCLGEGLEFGYFGGPIISTIDTRKAGPGELTAYCNGPMNKAYCQLIDSEDGTFTLVVTPQDVGLHQLYIKYNDVSVPGSPFDLRVSSASLVDIKGPGIHSGIFNQHDCEFYLITKDAGPGSIKVRVGGPSGAFKVETKKDGDILRCRYNPKVPGLYVIHVFWSGDHVPGSPFHVFIAQNYTELEQYTSKSTLA